MKELSILILALLSGCAVPTTGVVPRGDGLYTVTRQGDGGWITPYQLTSKALAEAGQYCDTKKKSIKVVYSKELPARPLGGWPESEVLFKCE